MIADKILYHGVFYTEDPKNPFAEAVAINGKKLIYVGDSEGAMALAGPETKMIDLEGKTVVPGLIDGHLHPETVSKTWWHAVSRFTYDKEELLEDIREKAQAQPKEKIPYLYYESYFTETFGEKGPDRWMLDSAVSDRPARIDDFTGHACCYNTKALEMLCDENGVPQVESSLGETEFKKDENGNYTGWALEASPDCDRKIYEKLGWQPPETVHEEMAKPLLDYLKEYGVMAMMDGYTEGDENMRFFYEMDKAGKLGMFFEASVLLEEVGSLEDSILKVREWQEKYSTEHVHCNTIKFFADGTNEIGDSLSLEPFYNDPEHKYYGHANATAEQIRDVLVRLNEEDIDFHSHIVGDATFRLMCDGVEMARKICRNSWRIRVGFAHCELIHPDDADRVADLGIYIDWSTHWAGGFFGTAAQAFLGKERWESMYDFSRILETGGKVGFSSDIYTYWEAPRADPWFGMQVSMTRKDPWFPLDPEKFEGSVRLPLRARLTKEQLLAGYTAVNAERLRLSDRMGSIEAGKLANLVVLEQDIKELPRERFGEINVLYTFFEGEKRKIISSMKRRLTL